MTDPFKKFWELLESDFPLGGPRHYLAAQLGAEFVQQLKTLGVLRHRRVADTYPCPGPMDIGCPRAIIDTRQGAYRAVCGNTPELCRELELNAEDISFLSVDMPALCRVVAQALRVGGVAEELNNLRHAYRVGTFIPVQSIRYPVYLVAHCARRDYAEAFHALRSQATSPTFAILVPTYDHLADEETRHHMQALGIPVLALDGVLNLQGEQLVSSVDPLRYFKELGRYGSAPVPIMGGVIAQALVCDGDGEGEWRNLNEGAYQRLVEAAGNYEIFADERGGRATWTSEGQSEHIDGLPASYFHLLRACIDHRHRGYYDPGAIHEEYDDAKQLFVRARKAVDVEFKHTDDKKEWKDWKLFKTRHVDKSARYEFSPEPGTSYALIFRPGPSRS